MDDGLARAARNVGRAFQRLGASSVALGWPAVRAAVRAAWLALRVAALPFALVVSAVAAFVLVAFLPTLLGQSWVGKAADYLARIDPALVPQALREPAKLAKNVYLGVAAFGGVVVLATFKDLANSIPNYWAFVKRPSFSELLQPCALTFIAFLGLSMSLFAVAEVSREKPIVHLRFVASGLPYDTPPDDALLRFYVVFTDEAGPRATEDEKDPSISVDPFLGSLRRVPC